VNNRHRPLNESGELAIAAWFTPAACFYEPQHAAGKEDAVEEKPGAVEDNNPRRARVGL
jgi:hypothetical protein